MRWADADGPSRRLAAEVIITNSSLDAAGDGLSADDGTSMASAVAGLCFWLQVRYLRWPASHPERSREVSSEDRDGAHLVGPAAETRCLLERQGVLPEQAKPRVTPSAAVRSLVKPDEGLLEAEEMGYFRPQLLLERDEG